MAFISTAPDLGIDALRFTADALNELYGDPQVTIVFNEQNHLDYRKRVESLKYTYRNELSQMFVNVKKFDDIFYVEEGQHPLLLKQHLAKKVSLETMCILEELLNYCKYWNDDIDEKYVWPQKEKLIKDYLGVLTFDKESCRVVTMQTIKESFDGK